MTRRLAISGYYGFGNAGDEAVLAAMVRALRAVDPGVELTVISQDPTETALRHGVGAVSRRPLDTLRALRAADGLVSGGGGLLQDATSFRSLAYYAGLVLLAAVLRRPSFVYAQGIGPIRRRASRVLAGMALRRARYVSVRDHASEAEVRRLGVRRGVDVVPDPAVALPPPKRPDRPRGIVVALRPWRGWDVIEAPIVAALSELARERDVRFVAMQPQEDAALSQHVAKRVGGSARLVPYETISELLDTIGSSELVVGMRLHALVLAAAARVPFAAISYDPKVDGFAAELAQPVIARVGEKPDGERVAAEIRRHLADDHGAYLAAVDRLAKQATKPAESLLAAVR